MLTSRHRPRVNEGTRIELCVRPSPGPPSAAPPRPRTVEPFGHAGVDATLVRRYRQTMRKATSLLLIPAALAIAFVLGQGSSPAPANAAATRAYTLRLG